MSKKSSPLFIYCFHKLSNLGTYENFCDVYNILKYVMFINFERDAKTVVQVSDVIHGPLVASIFS